MSLLTRVMMGDLHESDGLARKKRRKISPLPLHPSSDSAKNPSINFLNESPILPINSSHNQRRLSRTEYQTVPSSTPLRHIKQPEVVDLVTAAPPVVYSLCDTRTEEEEDIISATPPPQNPSFGTRGEQEVNIQHKSMRRDKTHTYSTDMFDSSLSCTDMMDSGDDVVYGTPDYQQEAPAQVKQSDDNVVLDDLISDLQKHQTPTKSPAARLTPSKAQKLDTGYQSVTDEFTLLESDSIFNITEPSKKEVKTNSRYTESQTQDKDSQSLFSPPAPESQSDSQQQQGDLISRLQRRYKRGIELASQPITQAITSQNTQQVQQRRYTEVQKAAQQVVSNQDLSHNCPNIDTGFYGLPDKVRQALSNIRGITKLYDWQDECLKLECLKQRSNLIYSSPTSGGKTLVAEILMLREILLHKRDCLLILPFVSLVQEKIRGMSELAVELDFLVEEYAGSRGTYPPKKKLSRKSIYISTIEKASGLINSLIDTRRLDSIGLCVVDELHMVGESDRGATLEVALTKLRLVNKKAQIVGMSATLSNMNEMAQFLDAQIYSNNFRPVQLEEYVKMGDDIFKVDPSPVDLEEKLKHERMLVFDYSAAMKVRDPDYLTGLLLEVIPRYSCLVFCPTKKNCESVATMVTDLMPRKMREEKKEERSRLLLEMEATCGKLCPVLTRTIPYGVVYHHSGLTMDERKLIEEAYISGTLCCIICTSTLAAGVNLPAKRVIIRAPYVGRDILKSSQYRQMCGRAGRAGIDSSGESILIIKKNDESKMRDLISGDMASCKSKLNADSGRGMRRFILNLIGIKLCCSVEEIYQALGSSLFAVQNDPKTVREACDTALSDLAQLNLIIQKSNSEGEVRLETTQLGLAAYKGCVDVDITNRLHTDLCDAQLALSVQNYLHLIYLITPYDLVSQVTPDWSVMFNLHGRLKKHDAHVADTVGVSERYLHLRTMRSKSDQKEERRHTRFFVALMLYDLYREMPVWQVADKYKQSRGFVQSMLQSAISFASCVYYFSMELEQFWAYHALYEQFIRKFSLCAKPELNALMELPAVKIGRARLLYKAGYRTIQEIAYAEVTDIVQKVDYMTRSNAKQIKASAMMLIQDKYEELRAEADAVIALPTPVPDISL